MPEETLLTQISAALPAVADLLGRPGLLYHPPSGGAHPNSGHAPWVAGEGPNTHTESCTGRTRNETIDDVGRQPTMKNQPETNLQTEGRETWGERPQAHVQRSGN